MIQDEHDADYPHVSNVDYPFVFHLDPWEDCRDPDNDPDAMVGRFFVQNEDCDPVYGPYASEAAARMDPNFKHRPLTV